MEILVTIISGLVIICLLGAMLNATKAIKEKDNKKLQGDHLRRMGMFLAGYGILNILRLFLESKIG